MVIRISTCMLSKLRNTVIQETEYCELYDDNEADTNVKSQSN